MKAMEKAIKRTKLSIAVKKAMRKEQDKKDFNFCLKWSICPECTGDLICSRKSAGELGEPLSLLPIILTHKCTKCGFEFII